MSAYSFSKTLRDGGSLLALSTVLITAQPAQATDGLFGGGSTLASLALRQEGDCYKGASLQSQYTFTAGFNPATPTPAWLPTQCQTHTTIASFDVWELYAGVGSGAGLRGYVSNDPQQLFRTASGFVATTTASQSILLPADQPKFKDSTGAFAHYPYPRLDFGAADSPLPDNIVTTAGTYGAYVYNVTPTTDWATPTVTRTNTTSTVSYSTGSFGQPIQLPLFEAPVAIAVNLPAVDATLRTTTSTSTTTVTWTIKSQFSTTAPGGRIQLSTAQICAIFSGRVTNWNSTTVIPYLKNDGTTGAETFAAANTFDAGNASAGTGGGTAYASASVPITIVYRSDGSGTSYIFTNYLKTVCPLLDPSNTYGYQTIFNTSVLPNQNFTQLINKVTAYGRTLNTVGASGSDAVAAAIGTTAANYGYIGYLSNDFVAPYNPVVTTRPHSASLQNDYLRANGVYHPGQSISGVAKDFIAATPTSADAAWTALATYGVAPSVTWTYADYNIYAKSFPATTYLVGSGTSVDITGLSVLPLANGSAAYPAVGAPFVYLYSCYGTGRDGVSALTRVTKLKDYLNWYYDNAQAGDILANNGFHALPAATWVNKIQSAYLSGTDSKSITDYDALNKVNGCSGVIGGAQ